MQFVSEQQADHHSPRQRPGPPCPKCKTPSRFMTFILDAKRNRPINIFRCDGCREEVWDGVS